MYPKVVPPALLPGLLQLAQENMHTLDLQFMDVFDASATQGDHTVTGNTNLNPETVQAYFENMPDSIAFLNGYAPAYTTDFTNGSLPVRSVLSFDYYLDPDRNVTDAAQDLANLASVNAARPYFMMVHVREFSTCERVAEILSLLGDEFVTLPVDTFFRFANQHPNFRRRYN
jgi:hypothetical protein